ncbi:MAG: glycosyltransferase [Elusimicrobiota bacterium]
MKIAIMGFRGIPANYGGFETFIEELAPRLVQKGHKVTVYCRSNNIKYSGKYYKGVELIILPTISHKYFDTISHTFLSVFHASFRRFEVVLMLNAANSPIAFIPRLTGKKVALNVDGIERMRKKWNLLGRLYYRMGEFFATKFPNVIVSDADVIEKYYLDTYNSKSVMIPYGAKIERIESKNILFKFNVDTDGYILYVSRLEPENNAHVVIEAFRRTKTDKKLIIVGDAPYSGQYKEKLKNIAAGDKRIIFTGFVFGEGYREFQCNAFCYIQATEVGGTHPALIEAMGFGNCVLANDTPENIEVVDDAAVMYAKNDVEDLAAKLQDFLDHPEKRDIYRKKAVEQVRRKYSWEAVTDKYENLFSEMLK